VFFGVTLLGELCLGKQETQKALAWSAGQVGVQSEGEARERFALHGRGSLRFEEWQPHDPSGDSTYSSEQEPRLPWDAADLKAALIRASSHVSLSKNRDGTVTVHSGLSRAGNELKRLELIREDFPDDQTMTTEEFIRTAENFGKITMLDPTFLEETAGLLGDWLTLGQSHAEYSFDMTAGGPVGFEQEGVVDFRRPWTLGTGSSSEAEPFTWTHATRTETTRGSHPDGSVDLEGYAEVPLQGKADRPVRPEEIPPPAPAPEEEEPAP